MTKKAFIEELSSHENVLVAVGTTSTPLMLNNEFVRDCEGTLNGFTQVPWRRCIERHATYLLFTGGSRIGFDQSGKFNYYEVVPEGTENHFKVKKYLVQEHPYDNGVGMKYKYLIYAVR